MLWLIILIAFSLPWNDLANNFDGFSSGCQTNYPSSTISRIPFLKPTPPAEIVPALLFAPFLPAPVAPVLLSSPPAAGPVASLAAPAVQWFMIHVNKCLFREGRELWKLENNKSLGGISRIIISFQNCFFDVKIGERTRFQIFHQHVTCNTLGPLLASLLSAPFVKLAPDIFFRPRWWQIDLQTKEIPAFLVILEI